MSIICAENLTKCYGSKVCVSDLSFEIGENCVLGFIGPNGAGKTTTMRMLCGIMPPSSGRAVINGFDVAEDPVSAKSSLGYLPENAPLNSGMTVEAFLRYCGGMRQLCGRELSIALDRVTEECSLKSVLREEVDSLSKGFRRRVCLAQSIMHQPKALVLDEPTDGLDPNQKREIRALIKNLSRNSAVIVSTHILEEIDAVCDRVLTIRQGHKVFDGTKAEFLRLVPEKLKVFVRLAVPEPEKALEIIRKESGLNILESEKKPGTVEFLASGSAPEEKTECRILSMAARENWEVEFLRTREAGPDEIFAALVSSSSADPACGVKGGKI